MGTQKDPKQVFGRDALIRQIWNCLKRPSQDGSLRFTAERRIGKTTVMTKMAAEPEAGFEVLFLEVEGIDSCNSLNELLLTRMRQRLTASENLLDWWHTLRKNANGMEIGGVLKLPHTGPLTWQDTLEKAIEGFCLNRPRHIVVLMFDELPYMLQKIEQVSSKAGKVHEAITLLDLLRALRQRHSNLRMIFAGSVGLHHVVRELKHTKLASEPVNNMPLVEIGPLEHSDALRLAIHLLNAASVACADDQSVIAEQLVDQANGIPFYMERLVGHLSLLNHPLTQQDVTRAVREYLTSDHDPWEMDHFRSRLRVYYNGLLTDNTGRSLPEYMLAQAILDHLAVSEQPQSIEQVWSTIRSQFALTDRSIVVQLLKLLAQDHYLSCDLQKRYQFRFSLVRNWWKIAQGLQS